MINLRYHIVSITAVFLALAIGVVMGTSFLSKASIDQLKTQIRNAEQGIQKTKAANSRLTARLRQLDEQEKVLRQQGQQLLAGRLLDEPVLIIASAGVDRDSLASLQSTLQATAADFRGMLVLTDKLRLAGEDSAKMAELLGMTSTDRLQVRGLLTSRVAQMLSNAGQSDTSGSGPPFGRTTTTTTTRRPTTPTTRRRTAPTTTTTRPIKVEQPTLLTDLRDGGWLTYEPPPNGSSDDALLTAGGYRYVVVTGPDVAIPDRQFLGPVLTALGEDGPAPVVVATAAVGTDPEINRTSVVGPIRSNNTLNKNLTTVDDLESFVGQVAVVLAIEGLDEVHGHYGVGKDATSLLPPPP